MTTNQKPFKMTTVVNGLEVITGETAMINIRISSPTDPRNIIMAYMGSQPYVTLVRDFKHGRMFTGVQGAYDSIQRAVEGHGIATTLAIEQPESIRHSSMIEGLAEAMLGTLKIIETTKLN